MDFKVYLDKVKNYFKSFPDKAKHLPEWFNALPKDEKIAYSSIFAGIFLILISFFLW